MLPLVNNLISACIGISITLDDLLINNYCCVERAWLYHNVFQCVIHGDVIAVVAKKKPKLRV